MAPRRDDDAMGGLLRRSLSGESSPGEPCPEPGTLAAFYERTLADDERERYELHIADCSRCREQLAVLVRSDEKTHPEPRAAWVWDWRWLAATAAVLVLVLSWSVRRSARTVTSERSSEPALLAQSEPNQAPASKPALPPVPPSVVAPASNAAGADSARAPAPLQEAAKARKQSVSPAPPVSNQLQAATNAPLDSRSYANEQDLKKATGAATLEAAPAQPDAASASALAQTLPEAPTAKTKAAGVAPTAPVSNSEAAGGARQAGPKRAAALAEPRDKISATSDKDKAPIAAAQNGSLSSESRSGQVLISTPDAKVSWRIREGGFVERTTDGGATWQGQQPDADAQLVAGSAPSAKVCWLAGKSGAIVMTKDAVKWRKIPPPVMADITGVAAMDASHATVTTTEGQRFTTTNAGKKWQPAQ
jgi:hypothetical protein